MPRVRVRATGDTDADGNATFTVTSDVVVDRGTVTRERLVRLEGREDAILQAVTAMKALADAHGPGIIRRALAELKIMDSRDAGPAVVARAAEAKALFTDAVAAIDALP